MSDCPCPRYAELMEYLRAERQENGHLRAKVESLTPWPEPADLQWMLSKECVANLETRKELRAAERRIKDLERCLLDRAVIDNPKRLNSNPTHTRKLGGNSIQKLNAAKRQRKHSALSRVVRQRLHLIEPELRTP